MSRDSRGYNGLRPIGGQNVPMIGQPRPTVEQAIEIEINSLARALFLATAPGLIPLPSDADFEALATRCKEAAAGFMLGVWIIERKPQDDSPADE